MKSIIAILLVTLLSVPALAMDEIGIWDCYEHQLQNGKDYYDPYMDVELKTSFKSPSGKTYKFWGFYDGGETWKFRFMPDELGEWAWSASFSDRSEKQSGTFTCVESDIPGMISQDQTNPMWFGYKSGKHELIRSFHVGDRFFAENWPASERQKFLDWAEAQGYNMFSIASHYLNRDMPGRGRGWDTPDLWPLDAAEFQKMEAILNELKERKIMVFPFAGFLGKASDFPGDQVIQEKYLRYVLARIAPYWNLLFNIAGPEPLMKRYVFLSKDELTRIGRLINALDIFNHPLAVHNATMHFPFRDSDWSSFVVLQGPKTTNRKKLSRGLLQAHADNKPLYVQETLWGGNTYGHPEYTKTDIRKNAYVINMAAGALNFGDMDGSSSSGFSGTLDFDRKHQEWHDIVHQVWDFFETVPFHAMKPRQDLVSEGYCLADDGKRYLIYLESMGKVDIDIKPGVYSITWINAQDTNDRRDGGATTTGNHLIPPLGGDDWILDLKKE